MVSILEFLFSLFCGGFLIRPAYKHFMETSPFRDEKYIIIYARTCTSILILSFLIGFFVAIKTTISSFHSGGGPVAVVQPPAPMPVPPPLPVLPQQPGSTIETTPGTEQDLVANIGDRVFFTPKSYDLGPNALATLGRQVAWLKEYPNINILVAGNDDSSNDASDPNAKENSLKMAALRAEAVGKYLVQEGIDESRIQLISYGEDCPISTGYDEASDEQNRTTIISVQSSNSEMFCKGQPETLASTSDNDQGNNSADSLNKLANDAVKKKNYQKAFSLYRQSAEQGDAEGENELGNLYLLGEGTKQNNQEAKNWYQKSADQGDVDGELLLGNIYAEGDGVPVNSEMAEKYYLLAANQGGIREEDYIADFYGSIQNWPQAFAWYLKAANQGDLHAEYNLAMMYYSGQGTQDDFHKSVFWMKKAADQGDAGSEFQFALLLAQARQSPGACEAAQDYMDRAAHHGLADAKAWLKSNAGSAC